MGEALAQTLAAIESKEKALDRSVEEYFSKYTLESFKRVMNVASKTISKDVDEVDGVDLVDRREVCNRLWVLKGLLDEFRTSSSVEVRAADVVKLRRKITEFCGFLSHKGVPVESVGIVKALKNEVDAFSEEVMAEIRTLFKRFLHFDTDLNVTFNKQLEDGMTFELFVQLCESFSKNVSLFDLRKLFSEWLGESLQKLHHGFIVELKTGEFKVELNYKSTEFTLEGYFESVSRYIELFNFIVDNSLDIFQFVKPTVSKTLLSDVKDTMFANENVKELLTSTLVSKDALVGALRKINSLLEEWPNEANDLEFWIDDLSRFWVESLVSGAIDEVKVFVKKLHTGRYAKELEELATAELETESNTGKNTQKQHELKTEPNPQEKDGWDDEWDDGWDEEEEAHEPSPAIEEPKEEIEAEVEDDEGWDAWGDDDDLDIEEESTPPPVPAPTAAPANASAPSKFVSTVAYKYTPLTQVLLDIIDTYYANVYTFKGLVDGDEYENLTLLLKSGIKKIMVSVHMMVQVTKGYPNLVLFYNDYSRVLDECSRRYETDLTTNFKMSSRFIQSHLNEYYSPIESLFNEYNSSMWYDSASGTRKASMEFNIRISNLVGDTLAELKNLRAYNERLLARTEITVLFQTLNLLCDKLLSRNDISSEECETFVGVIDELVMAFAASGINLGQVQSFNKVQQIKSILGANLKEIAARFYDGEFYELETFELVGLIKALFVDSSNREDLLVQIKSVREVDLE